MRLRSVGIGDPANVRVIVDLFPARGLPKHELDVRVA
jgi:hypothetical protein